MLDKQETCQCPKIHLRTLGRNPIEGKKTVSLGAVLERELTLFAGMQSMSRIFKSIFINVYFDKNYIALNDVEASKVIGE